VAATIWMVETHYGRECHYFYYDIDDGIELDYDGYYSFPYSLTCCDRQVNPSNV
jgi:hypothetical protein